MTLPRQSGPMLEWDLASVFPGPRSPELRDALEDLERRTVQLESTACDDLDLAGTCELLDGCNAAFELAIRVDGYLQCRLLSGEGDDNDRLTLNRSKSCWNRLIAIERRLTQAASEIEPGVLSAHPPTLQAHAFWLERALHRKSHRMSTDAERVANRLSTIGGQQWERLRHRTVDDLQIPKDGAQPATIASLQQRAHHPDRHVRTAAFKSELEAWQGVAPTVAACLNGIKGEAFALSELRDWSSPLEESLAENHFTRETLEAMLDAAGNLLPEFQRYLTAKATALGLETLAWYDLHAPLTAFPVTWEYEDSQRLIVETFHGYSTSAGAFAERVFAERWIDAGSRHGKRAGGCCIPVWRGESRILVSYSPTFSGLRMLAHEIGHAYHNHVLYRAGRSAIQHQMTPWILAETSAIFFESLVREAAMQRLDEREQAAEAEAALQFWCRHIVDVLSSFRFEQGVFARLPEGELSVEELNAQMRDAQRSVYGDGVDQSTLHPYMWAAKPQMFDSASSFNNYPYMFGTLFSLGLQRRFRDSHETFALNFDRFLSDTGMASTETLAESIQVDLRSSGFWETSAAVITSEVNRFLNYEPDLPVMQV